MAQAGLNGDPPATLHTVWLTHQDCRPLDPLVEGTPPEAGFAWMDVPNPEDRAWLPAAEALTGLTGLADLLAPWEAARQPSTFAGGPHYDLLIFRGLVVQGPPLATESWRLQTEPTLFVLTERALISLGANDAATRDALRQRYRMRTALPTRLPTQPSELLLRLLNDMVDRYLNLRQPLTDRLDTWQRALLDPRRPFNDWVALLDARRQLRKLENLCEEQLDALQEWRDARLDQLGSRPLPPWHMRLNDLTAHIERVRSHAHRLEGAVESAVQLHFSATAHRTNQIMRTLTVITAIFMPLNLITGIFGMNFEALPGIHSPGGFWWTLGTMALISLLLMGFFRARRYLEPERRRRARAAARSRQKAQHNR